MSIIDPTRIAAIFRALSVTGSDGTNTHKKNVDKKAVATASVKIERVQEKDKEELKKKLRILLIELKAKDVSFEEKAPSAVIKEILLWEFGEDFFNHPQFNRISRAVSDQMLAKQASKDYFFKIVDELIS